MKWRITIIRPVVKWPGNKHYSSERAETYTAQGESFTEARDNMDREQGLTHVDYMTVCSDLIEPGAEEARS